MLQDFINNALGVIGNILAMLPDELKLALLVLGFLLFCGYENQQKAKRAAAEEERKRTMRGGNSIARSRQYSQRKTANEE